MPGSPRDIDSIYMMKALKLALKGEGRVNPNPMVGAILVKDGKIIGEGYHHSYGSLHAERDAIKDCREKGNDPSGSRLYVTLEPCCHQGKQPPCTEAILEAGITSVVTGSRDPNPLVHGKGIAFLREHGIEVHEDCMKSECDKINQIFFHYIVTKTPYVALKFAMTADGKIATVEGKSKWISCPESLEFVHKLRNRYSAILAGIGTVLADDPLLTCRLPGGRNPIRIILDSKLSISLDSKIVRSAQNVRTIVVFNWASVAGCGSGPKMKVLKEKNVELIECGDKNGKINIPRLFIEFGKMGIDSILVEGGAKINWSMLKENCVKKIYQFIAPKIFGGDEAKGPVAGSGIAETDDAFRLKMSKVSQIGQDILLEWEVK